MNAGIDIFQPLTEACQRLQEEPQRRMVRVLVEPDLDELFMRWLTAWERSTENNQVVLWLDTPFKDLNQYVRALYDQVQQRRTEAAPSLAEKKLELPPPVPFDEQPGKDVTSLVDELNHLGTKTAEVGGQLVVTLIPQEMSAPDSWCQAVELLLKQLSQTSVGLLTLDRPDAPSLQTLVSSDHPLSSSIESVSLRPDPERIQGELEKRLKMGLPTAERVSTLLMLAGFDTAHGRLDQAFAHQKQALDLCRSGELKAQEAVIRYNLGGILLGQNKPLEAKVYLEQAGVLAVRLENYPLATNAAIGLGECHDKLNEPEQALRYFSEGAKLASLAGAWHLSSQAYHRAGQLLAKLGRYEEASQALKLGKNQLDNLGEPFEQMIAASKAPLDAELARIRDKAVNAH